MLLHLRQHPCPLSHCFAMPLPGLRLPASASLPLASCWPRPQQLLPVSATGGGRRRCSQRESWRVAPERASPGQKSFCAAISRFFVRAILSLCFYISVSILALSVIASQCHLSQRERLWQAGRRKKTFRRLLLREGRGIWPTDIFQSLIRSNIHLAKMTK